jgi:hypothetical protein
MDMKQYILTDEHIKKMTPTNHSKEYLVERLGDDNCDIYCYQDNMFDITKTMNER